MKLGFIIKRLAATAMLLLLFFTRTIAQDVTVQVTDTTGRIDSVRSVIAENEISNLKHYQGGDLRNLGAGYQDSVRTLAKEYPIKNIYSEKHLQAIKDSIHRVTGFKVPQDVSNKVQVDQDDLLNILNEKFPHWPEPKVNIPDTNIPVDPENFPVDTEIERLELPAPDLMSLSPLSGNLVESRHLKAIDSLRKLHLKNEKLRLREEQISAKAKITTLREKPSFWQKSYFEGVLGLWTGKDITIYQAAPAIGYHFTNYFSLGAGPTVQLHASGKRANAQVGLRTFSKIEFLKRQVYLQVEDSMHPYDSRGEAVELDRHNVFVGGGALLSLKTSFSLNICVLYKVNESSLAVSDISPFVFRLGISSIKIEK